MDNLARLNRKTEVLRETILAVSRGLANIKPSSQDIYEEVMKKIAGSEEERIFMESVVRKAMFVEIKQAQQSLTTTTANGDNVRTCYSIWGVDGDETQQMWLNFLTSEEDATAIMIHYKMETRELARSRDKNLSTMRDLFVETYGKQATLPGM